MKYVFVIAILILAANANAQNFHITLFGGMSNYQGDLQDKRFTLDQSHPAAGGGVMFEITDNFFARATVIFAKVSGDDKTSNSIYVRDRNLNFSSLITDVNLAIEYDILSLYQSGFTPYIYGGIGYYHFNPYTFDSANNKIYLQPLGTEGQGFYNGRTKYSLDQFSIPFGGGIKFALGDNIRISIEGGLRKLFTDYLDDVSSTFADQNLLLAHSGPQAVEVAFRGDELKKGLTYPPVGSIRGNPKNKDLYYVTGITLSIRLTSARNSGGNKSKVGCPTRIY